MATWQDFLDSYRDNNNPISGSADLLGTLKATQDQLRGVPDNPISGNEAFLGTLKATPQQLRGVPETSSSMNEPAVALGEGAGTLRDPYMMPTNISEAEQKRVWDSWPKETVYINQHGKKLIKEVFSGLSGSTQEQSEMTPYGPRYDPNRIARVAALQPMSTPWAEDSPTAGVSAPQARERILSNAGISPNWDGTADWGARVQAAMQNSARDSFRSADSGMRQAGDRGGATGEWETTPPTAGVSAPPAPTGMRQAGDRVGATGEWEVTPGSAPRFILKPEELKVLASNIRGEPSGRRSGGSGKGVRTREQSWGPDGSRRAEYERDGILTPEELKVLASNIRGDERETSGRRSGGSGKGVRLRTREQSWGPGGSRSAEYHLGREGQEQQEGNRESAERYWSGVTNLLPPDYWAEKKVGGEIAAQSGDGDGIDAEGVEDIAEEIAAQQMKPTAPAEIARIEESGKTFRSEDDLNTSFQQFMAQQTTTSGIRVKGKDRAPKEQTNIERYGRSGSGRKAARNAFLKSLSTEQRNEAESIISDRQFNDGVDKKVVSLSKKGRRDEAVENIRTGKIESIKPSKAYEIFKRVQEKATLEILREGGIKTGGGRTKAHRSFISGKMISVQRGFGGPKTNITRKRDEDLGKKIRERTKEYLDMELEVLRETRADEAQSRLALNDFRKVQTDRIEKSYRRSQDTLVNNLRERQEERLQAALNAQLDRDADAGERADTKESRDAEKVEREETAAEQAQHWKRFDARLRIAAQYLTLQRLKRAGGQLSSSEERSLEQGRTLARGYVSTDPKIRDLYNDPAMTQMKRDLFAAHALGIDKMEMSDKKTLEAMQDTLDLIFKDDLVVPLNK